MKAQMASLDSRIEDNNEKFEALQRTLVSQMDRHQEKMDTWIADMKEGRKETTAGQEANPEKMESAVEHGEGSKKEVAMTSSRTTKKRHRGRNLAAGRRGKPKELTRRDCGSRKKLDAACR
jgi:hypothetical protein